MIAHSVTQIANGTRRFRCMFGQIQNAVRFSVPHPAAKAAAAVQFDLDEVRRNRIMVQGRLLILWIGGGLAGRVRPLRGGLGFQRPGNPMKVTGKPAGSTARLRVGCSRWAPCPLSGCGRYRTFDFNQSI